MTRHYHRQSGNALWFILVAILLLGGLTVLLSRSSSMTEDSGDYERMQIQASELLRYAKSIALGAQQLATRGCSESEISFWYDSNNDGTDNATARFHNPNSPPDRRCHVFYPEGAGIAYKPPRDIWFAPTGHKADYVTAEQCIAYVGTGETTCTRSNTDLMYQVIAVNTTLCLAINNLVGVTNPSGVPPQEVHADTIFAGSFDPNGTAATALITSAQLDAKQAGCFTSSGGTFSGQNIFYHVVLPR